MSEHRVSVTWQRGDAEFAYQKYPRDHFWSFDGGHTMMATAAPSHVGKIYNVLAKDIAETLVSAILEVSAAQCLMVSRIGAPVSVPAVTQTTRDKTAVGYLRSKVEELVASRIDRIPELIAGFVAGTIEVF